MPNLLDLGPGDAPALARFECRSFGEPWSARQGYGLTLKTEVLARARRAGCVVALSSVHEDNEPMLRLNQRLGARLERDPAHPTYLDCTIDL